MKQRYEILKNIQGLNGFDKLLCILLKKYTYKIYNAGVKNGYYFNE